jgi:hypothetical protein
MKNFRAADKSHAGGDEKHDINFNWPHGLWATEIIYRFRYKPLIAYIKK